MMRAGAKSLAGFTLVELLVGATLSAAVLAGVLSSYIYIGRNLARLSNQQTLETEARRTLASFSRDVRMASGLTDTANLSATRVSFTVPTANSTNTITYYYNSTPIALSPYDDSDDVTVNGFTVAMRREALTRCVYDGTTVSSLVLLRNITTNGVTLRYYDAADREYTTYTNYLPGIKQVALEFSTQLGTSGSGTQTKVYQVASNRLILRNQDFLP